MWKLLKAELDYNKYMLLGFSIFMVFMVMVFKAMVDFSTGDGLRMSYFYLPFIMVSAMFGRLRREKRDRLNILLPISSSHAAAIRLMHIYLPFLSTVLLVNIVSRLTGFSLFSGTLSWIGVLGFYILIFLIYLVVRDLTGNPKKGNREFSDKRHILKVLLFFTLLGMFLINITANRDGFSSIFTNLNREWFEFTFSQEGAIIAYSLTIILAVVSIYTFRHKKSYLCN